MLMTTELVRDVLCCEVIKLDKLIKSLSCPQQKDMSMCISNMTSILMSPNDFVHVEEGREDG